MVDADQESPRPHRVGIEIVDVEIGLPFLAAGVDDQIHPAGLAAAPQGAGEGQARYIAGQGVGAVYIGNGKGRDVDQRLHGRRGLAPRVRVGTQDGQVGNPPLHHVEMDDPVSDVLNPQANGHKGIAGLGVDGLGLEADGAQAGQADRLAAKIRPGRREPGLRHGDGIFEAHALEHETGDGVFRGGRTGGCGQGQTRSGFGGGAWTTWLGSLDDKGASTAAAAVGRARPANNIAKAFARSMRPNDRRRADCPQIRRNPRPPPVVGET